MKTNKNTIVKAISMVMALTLSAGLFTGCTNKKSDKDEQGRTMISIGGWPTKESVDLDNINARKERYESENTDVVVTPDSYKFDRQTFYAKAAGNQLPTLYDVGFTEIPEIIASGYSADLTDVLKKRGYEGMFNEDILEIISDDEGRIRAFPYSAYVLGLVCNTDLMQQAGLVNEDGTPMQPKDWNEVAEFAVKIKEATGKAGFIMPSAGNVGGWLFTPIAWSYGVDFMEKDENGKWQATFDTPEAVAALQYVKDLKWKYDVLPVNTTINMDEYIKTFATGGAGMMINAGTFPGQVFQYDMPLESQGIVAFPAGPERHVTLLGGATYCISADATEDQIDACIRWLEDAYSFDLTENFKNNKIKTLDRHRETNVLVGVKEMSVWSEKSPALKWQNEIIDEKANANKNHVKLYNDFVLNCPAEIQAEEPVCAQELYAILDICIQEVFTDKDADCEAIIKKAVSDFQINYLDNLTY